MLRKNKLIAKNTFFLYFRLVVVLFLTLYISRIVLEVLGIEDFGIYNVVGGFVGMFAFLNTSMSNGVQRFFNVDIGANSGRGICKIFTTSLLIQMILAGLFLIIAEIIGLWYINKVMVIPNDRLPAANLVYQFSILSFLCVIMQVPYVAMVMAYERMNFFAFVSIVDVVLRFFAVYMLKFVVNIDTLALYSFLIFLVSIINFLIYLIYAHANFKFIKVVKSIDKKLFVQMVSFSGWNVFGSFAYMIKDQGLNLLLNGYFGPIVNAARAISYQVSNALNGFSGNIFTAFRPQLMQSYSSRDYDRTISLMFSMSKFTFFLMVLIAFPVIIEIRYILQLWLAKNIPYETEVFTILVILNMLVTNFNPPVSQIVHATGNMKRYQLITSFILTSILPISWLFLHYGAPAVSVFLICLFISVVNQFICLLVLKELFDYSLSNYCLKVVLPCFLVSIFAYPLSYLAHSLIEDSLIRLFIVFWVNIFVAVIAIYIFGLTSSERKTLVFIVKKMIKK